MNYLNLFGIQIPMYGLMLVLGLLVVNILGYRIIKRFQLDFNDMIILEAYGFACGMLGAKILYLWVSRNSIQWEHFFEREYFNAYMKGGFVFYGGLIGGVMGVLLVSQIHKIKVIEYMRVLICCIPIVHGFGRMGCFFAGCCYGIPYNGAFHVRYSNIPYSLCDENLFPVQLLEAVLLFLLGIILYILIMKYQRTEVSIEIYLISYSIIRFGLEYLRFDEARGKLYGVSTSQWISIGIVILIILYRIRFKINNQNITRNK